MPPERVHGDEDRVLERAEIARERRAEEHERLGADDRDQPAAVDHVRAGLAVVEGQDGEAEVAERQPHRQGDEPEDERDVVVPAQLELEAEEVGGGHEREREDEPRVDEVAPHRTRPRERAERERENEQRERGQGDPEERVREPVVAEVEEGVRDDPRRHHQGEVARIQPAQLVPPPRRAGPQSATASAACPPSSSSEYGTTPGGSLEA